MKRFDLHAVVILVTVITFAPKIGVMAADGDLDPGFGTGGTVRTPFAEYGTKVTIQPNGKIVIRGHSWVDYDCFIFRSNSDGTMDSGFGTGGKRSLGPTCDFVILPDGKILAVGGVTNSSDGFINLALFRFNAGGEPDASFGNNGVVELFIGGGGYGDNNVYGYKIAVHQNGQIHIAASANDGLGDFSNFVLRLHPDGSIAHNEVYLGYVNVSNLLVQPDGKFLVQQSSQIKRFNPDGTVDNGFGTNGSIELEVPEPPIYPGEMVLQSDGRILVNYIDNYAFTGVRRFNANGTPDASFGENGTVETPGSNAIAVQRNGKILLAGFGYQFWIIRLLPDGDFDPSFGGDGIVITDLPRSNARALAIQPDGKIVAVGDMSDSVGSRIAIARYENKRPAALFDFDGDLRADISVFRPSDRVWYFAGSQTGGYGVQWGLPTDRVVPADYDGDGRTDPAIFRDGAWWIHKSTGGYHVVSWGLPTDKLVPADYDGDGKTDPAIYRDGSWWILKSTGGYNVVSWGLPTDKPVPADYDGDGKTDPAIYRDGSWWILKSTGGYSVESWGLPNDQPVPADYDGDGKTDPAIFRDGIWWILKTTGGYDAISWGLPNDKLVPADYDGDGRADPAIFRDGTWWILKSTGGYHVSSWGLPDDKPAPEVDFQ